MILVQRGDHRAFSALYDRYASRMKAFFFRMLWSDHAKAEDFVHDLFTKVIERPELYQPHLPFTPWLFQVASNMCKNAYRRRAFEVAYLSQLDTNNVHAPAAEQKIDEELILKRLNVILEQLDEMKRELFLLRYQQQFSIRELAAIFNTTEGTIKSRLFHIRKTLLEHLNEEKLVSEYEKSRG